MFLNFLEILLKNIPRKAGYFFFRLAGRILSHIPSKRQRNVNATLFAVTGIKNYSSIRAKIYETYASYYYELFLDNKELLKKVDYSAYENSAKTIKRLLEKYGGCIMVSLHYGNWDLAGSFLASLFPGQVTVVVEELSPKVFKWFTKTRSSWGMKVLKSTDLKGMLKSLKDKNILVLLGDRDLEKNGYKIEMFGRKAHLPSGPAKLALMAKVPVVFSVFERINENGFEFRPSGAIILNDPPLERTEENALLITKKLVLEFENKIKSKPEMWCMLQNIWAEEKKPVNKK